MTFNVGERVKWRYSSQHDDPSQIRGLVEEIVFQYRVTFDDGTEELCAEEDLEAED